MYQYLGLQAYFFRKQYNKRYKSNLLHTLAVGERKKDASVQIDPEKKKQKKKTCAPVPVMW